MKHKSSVALPGQMFFFYWVLKMKCPSRAFHLALRKSRFIFSQASERPDNFKNTMPVPTPLPRRGKTTLFQIKIKQVLRLKINFVFNQKLKILFPERFLFMMLLLVFYIIQNHCDIFLRNRKRPKTFLPVKFAAQYLFIINKFCAVFFYFAHIVRQVHIGFAIHQQMDMVGHTIDNK